MMATMKESMMCGFIDLSWVRRPVVPEATSAARWLLHHFFNRFGDPTSPNRWRSSAGDPLRHDNGEEVRRVRTRTTRSREKPGDREANAAPEGEAGGGMIGVLRATVMKNTDRFAPLLKYKYFYYHLPRRRSARARWPGSPRRFSMEATGRVAARARPTSRSRWTSSTPRSTPRSTRTSPPPATRPTGRHPTPTAPGRSPPDSGRSTVRSSSRATASTPGGRGRSSASSSSTSASPSCRPRRARAASATARTVSASSARTADASTPAASSAMPTPTRCSGRPSRASGRASGRTRSGRHPGRNQSVQAADGRTSLHRHVREQLDDGGVR